MMGADLVGSVPMITRETVRKSVIEWLWLPEQASWGQIWERAKLLGHEMYERVRAYVSDQLDGQIPAF